MNTQQLETFIQVAENLNFARAAEILSITQSAVSRQIHSLEEELGTKLFLRSTRTVSLTPAGSIFLNDAKEVLGKLQLSSLKMKNQSNSNIQPLSIGCINEAELLLLTDLLRKCQSQLPEIHPFIRMIHSRSVYSLFVHGDIDILFGFKDDIPMRQGMHYKELMQLPVCCVIPEAHPFASRKEIHENELLSESMIVCNSYEFPSRIANIQNILVHQLPPESTYYCENPQVMLALVKAGYGIGILPKITSDVSDVTYVPLKGNISMHYGVFYKNISKNSIIKKFLALI